MNLARTPIVLALAPALLILALAGCTVQAEPAPTPAASTTKDVIGAGDVLTGALGAPTDQLLVAQAATDFANLQMIAQDGCTMSLMGEVLPEIPTEFEAAAAAYTAAQAAVTASGQATVAGFPATLPAFTAGDWCATSGELAKAAAAAK